MLFTTQLATAGTGDCPPNRMWSEPEEGYEADDEWSNATDAAVSSLNDLVLPLPISVANNIASSVANKIASFYNPFWLPTRVLQHYAQQGNPPVITIPEQYEGGPLLVEGAPVLVALPYSHEEFDALAQIPAPARRRFARGAVDLLSAPIIGISSLQSLLSIRIRPLPQFNTGNEPFGVTDHSLIARMYGYGRDAATMNLHTVNEAGRIRALNRPLTTVDNNGIIIGWGPMRPLRAGTHLDFQLISSPNGPPLTLQEPHDQGVSPEIDTLLQEWIRIFVAPQTCRDHGVDWAINLPRPPGPPPPGIF